MSHKGWMDVEIMVRGERNGDEARRWASGRRGFALSDGDGCVTVYRNDDAGWLDDELEWLEGELRKLKVPLSDWSAEVHYKSYEDPEESGAMVSLSIEDGKISEWKQSRIEMVDAEPLVEFDLTKGEA